jgi:hypothetical protein
VISPWPPNCLRIAEKQLVREVSLAARGEDDNRFAVAREALADALGADESGDVLEMRYEVESHTQMSHDSVGAVFESPRQKLRPVAVGAHLGGCAFDVVRRSPEIELSVIE